MAEAGRTPQVLPSLEELILARQTIARAARAVSIEDPVWDKLIEAKLFVGQAICGLYGDAGLERVMDSDWGTDG